MATAIIEGAWVGDPARIVGDCVGVWVGARGLDWYLLGHCAIEGRVITNVSLDNMTCALLS